MSRKHWPFAALALVAVVAASTACASKEAAHADGSNIALTTPARATGTPSLSKPELGVRFAECVREHGVPHFPDPTAAGDFVFGIDVSPQVWTDAVNACKTLQPPGTLSASRPPAQQTAALTFAQCVRANGVTDFPDPVNGQPLINTDMIPSANVPGGITILNAAVQKCHASLDAAAAGQ